MREVGRVLRPSPGRLGLLVTVLAVVLGVVVVLTASLSPGALSPVDLVGRWAAALVVTTFVVAVCWLWERRAVCWVVGPAGVEVRHGRRVRVIPWAEVQSVQVRPFSVTLRTTGRPVAETVYWFGGQSARWLAAYAHSRGAGC